MPRMGPFATTELIASHLSRLNKQVYIRYEGRLHQVSHVRRSKDGFYVHYYNYVSCIEVPVTHNEVLELGFVITHFSSVSAGIVQESGARRLYIGCWRITKAVIRDVVCRARAARERGKKEISDNHPVFSRALKVSDVWRLYRILAAEYPDVLPAGLRDKRDFEG